MLNQSMCYAENKIVKFIPKIKNPFHNLSALIESEIHFSAKNQIVDESTHLPIKENIFT